jgi:hypothetical protein
LTNLVFALQLPTGFLTNLAVESSAAQINAAPVQALSNGQWQLRFSATNPGLQGSQLMGRLNFTALTGQNSAFVPLRLGNVNATTASGAPQTNVWTYGGEIVLLGQEPILSILSSNRQPLLRFYDLPGSVIQLQTATNLNPPVRWHDWQRLTVTNLPTSTSDVPTNRALFYRAYRTNAP